MTIGKRPAFRHSHHTSEGSLARSSQTKHLFFFFFRMDVRCKSRILYFLDSKAGRRRSLDQHHHHHGGGGVRTREEGAAERDGVGGGGGGGGGRYQSYLQRRKDSIKLQQREREQRELRQQQLQQLQLQQLRRRRQLQGFSVEEDDGGGGAGGRGSFRARSSFGSSEPSIPDAASRTVR